MGRIAPTDACPPATLTEWRFYASQEGIDGTFMVNLRSGERLWRPPDSVWDLEWDIGYKPNPAGTWYRVPGTRRWVLLDIITCWIHDRPTARRWWYLVEDTAQPIACARPPLPHQIEFILAKLTLRRMTHSKRGSVTKPVESGRSLSPNSPRPISYVALCACAQWLIAADESLVHSRTRSSMFYDSSCASKFDVAWLVVASMFDA
jgi:hypothetical protein